MNFVMSASRLMKAKEVLEICQIIKNSPEILKNTEKEAKKRFYKQKTASAGTLTA